MGVELNQVAKILHRCLLHVLRNVLHEFRAFARELAQIVRPILEDFNDFNDFTGWYEGNQIESLLEDYVEESL